MYICIYIYISIYIHINSYVEYLRYDALCIIQYVPHERVNPNPNP